jgi:hypothetical protein
VADACHANPKLSGRVRAAQKSTRKKPALIEAKTATRRIWRMALM